MLPWACVVDCVPCVSRAVLLSLNITVVFQLTCHCYVTFPPVKEIELLEPPNAITMHGLVHVPSPGTVWGIYMYFQGTYAL